MNVTPVLALVNSRLRADVIIIKLRRVEIECGKISAVFPRRYMPNAVACWLRIPRAEDLRGRGDELLITGPLRTEFAKMESGSSMIDLMERVGFDPVTSDIIDHHLKSGATLLGVHGRTDAEVSLAWHVFKHLKADMIAIGKGLPESEMVAARAEFLPSWYAAA